MTSRTGDGRDPGAGGAHGAGCSWAVLLRNVTEEGYTVTEPSAQHPGTALNTILGCFIWEKEAAESTSEAALLFEWLCERWSSGSCWLQVHLFTFLSSLGDTVLVTMSLYRCYQTLYVCLSWLSSLPCILIVNHRSEDVCQDTNWGIRLIMFCRGKATQRKGGSFLLCQGNLNWRRQSPIFPR